MSQGKITGALICLFVVATSAGTVAAWNYSAQSVPQLSETVGIASTDPHPQTTNVDLKADRLPLSPVLEVAAAIQPAASEIIAAGHPAASSEPAPQASYAVASLAPTAVELPKQRRPIPVEKPKRVEPKGLLDDAQITSLRDRLKLTPSQEEFWPAVEITLREVVREHARKHRKAAAAGIAKQIDVNSPEVQRLISAAVPLIMRMSEDQKREVRQLARIIGLNEVAARI